MPNCLFEGNNSLFRSGIPWEKTLSRKRLYYYYFFSITALRVYGIIKKDTDFFFHILSALLSKLSDYYSDKVISAKLYKLENKSSTSVLNFDC